MPPSSETYGNGALPQTPVSPGAETADDQHGLRHQQRPSQSSNILHTPPPTSSPNRKAVPPPSIDDPAVRLQDAPGSPVSISAPRFGVAESEAASIQYTDGDDESRRSSRTVQTPDSISGRTIDAAGALPVRTRPSAHQVRMAAQASYQTRQSSLAYHHSKPEESSGQWSISEEEEGEGDAAATAAGASPGLQYHAFDEAPRNRPHHRVSHSTTLSGGSSSSGGEHRNSQPGQQQQQQLGVPGRSGLTRPASSYTLGSDLRGRTLSPLSAAGSDGALPMSRDSSARRSPSARPTSYVELLANVPYSQQIAPGPAMNNASLQSAVGNAASLLDTKKTLEMYRANVKKTNDAAVQYEFAIFMINAAREAPPPPADGLDAAELITEAKHILQRLSDRTYPFAQYYLGDGYFSGLFSKGKPDYDRAFPLFVAASKHGHAEAGYRAALCYEFGWGCAKSAPRAVQFYRNSASKNHPGAATRLGLACIRGDMGLAGRDKYREGVKWLKRATESADFQYNTAPYELGSMHLTGYGDDIFKDEAYAAQLLTQAAELGHVDANFLMGRAYENGLYGMPRDAALSVHFYNGAATRGHVEGMMALCAWYMVGAEPVLEKDEAEAYAWAKQAADAGYSKAEYAIGYFTEMGIGCRRDPLEANVWYVRAADQGNETAKQRLAIIRAAASGDPGIPMSKVDAKTKELGAGKDGKKKFMGIF